jgi:hypothetical protein
MTMSKHVILGAYWSLRQESAAECGDRFRQCLLALAKTDALFEQWFEQASSRAAALKRPADIADREYCSKLLDRGRLQFEDSGFIVGLWNGAEDAQSIGLSVTCGSYSPFVLNSVVISLPDVLGALEHSGTMCGALSAVARAWEPDWAGVMSRQAINSRFFEARHPFVDWMLYLPNSRLPKDLTLNPPAEVVPVDQIGSVIITQTDIPSPENPSHLLNVEAVEAALALKR